MIEIKINNNNHTEKYKGYDIEIYYDEDPENPRECDRDYIKRGSKMFWTKADIKGDK